jgi:hypothetical protein
MKIENKMNQGYDEIAEVKTLINSGFMSIKEAKGVLL